MRALVWIGVLAGCSFHGAAESLVDAARDTTIAGSDALADAPADAPADAQLVVTGDARFCLGSGLIQVCLDAAPTGSLMISGAISTQAATCLVVTQADGREVCVVARHDITIASAVTVTGMRPLVLLASDVITVSASGSLDVSSVRNPGRIGAGADWGGCPPEPTVAADNLSGGGGGGGGSFGTVGGAGGIGNFQQAVEAPGGVPPAAQLPAVVRGGCAGGNGGNGTIANSRGIAGHGGGALYLLAGTHIAVGGALLANGEGGGGGGDDGGGAGGGTGGLVGLEAPTIDVSALVAANGGGGGEGGDDNTGGGDAGNPGGDGIATITTPAAGGSGPPAVAGNGGEGAVAALAAGPGANQAAGGGGGGGATGVIFVKGTLSGGGMFSPAVSQH